MKNARSTVFGECKCQCHDIAITRHENCPSCWMQHAGMIDRTRPAVEQNADPNMCAVELYNDSDEELFLHRIGPRRCLPDAVYRDDEVIRVAPRDRVWLAHQYYIPKHPSGRDYRVVLSYGKSKFKGARGPSRPAEK